MIGPGFHPYGITLNTSDGPVTLAAGVNITILPQGNLVTIAAQNTAVSIANGVAWQPPAMADAAAPNNSVYYSTDGSALTYKDSAWTPHSLY